jgi:hypothetical protein
MAGGQIYKGHNVRISYNGKTLYHTTSCKWSSSRDFEEIATKDTEGKVSVPGNYGWDMNADALVANKPDLSTTSIDFMDIMDLYIAGTEIDVEFSGNAVGDWIISGKAYVSNADITADDGSVVKGTFAFKGNGDIVKALVA